jgi:hypothetical protein
MNTSIVYSSLKYLNNNFKLIVQLSIHIYDKLVDFNYDDYKLCLSFEKKDTEVIKSIIKFIQDKDLFDVYLWRIKDSEVVKLILDIGVEQGTKFRTLKKLIINKVDAINIVKLILDDKVYDIQTLLEYASRNADSKMIKLLLNYDVNPNMNGNKALWSAFYQNEKETGKLLLERSNLELINLNDLLRFASTFNCIDIIKKLINEGKNIHIDDELALKEAVECRNIEIVELLLENGANVHINDELLLKASCREKNYDIIKILVKYRANVNINSNQLIIDSYNKEDIKLYNILTNGSQDESFITNKDLFFACKNNRPNDVLRLIKEGAIIHEQNDLLLCYVFKKDYFLVAKILLENGADINSLQKETITNMIHYDYDVIKLYNEYKKK